MAQIFNSSLRNIAVYYLRLLHAKVTSTTIQKDIQENPYYPSLLSLSDTFSKYNINNEAFDVDKADFDTLDAPFVALASVPPHGKDFVLVTKTENEMVDFVYKSKKPESVPKEEFVKRFQNIVLFAEVNEQSQEINYIAKVKEEKQKKSMQAFFLSLAALLVIIAVGINATSENIISLTSIALIKFAGTAATILLMVYETDKSNAFVKNLCRGGAHINCDAVLNSKFAKIRGFSWAEIGVCKMNCVRI